MTLLKDTVMDEPVAIAQKEIGKQRISSAVLLR
jgi:hypothetical protein